MTLYLYMVAAVRRDHEMPFILRLPQDMRTPAESTVPDMALATYSFSGRTTSKLLRTIRLWDEDLVRASQTACAVKLFWLGWISSSCRSSYV